MGVTFKTKERLGRAAESMGSGCFPSALTFARDMALAISFEHECDMHDSLRSCEYAMREFNGLRNLHIFEVKRNCGLTDEGTDYLIEMIEKMRSETEGIMERLKEKQLKVG